jgi:hypothetical protein
MVREGATIRGRYFHEAKSNDFVLTGSVSDGRVQLNARTVQGEQSGRFEGTISSGDVLEGTWQDARSSQRLPFRFEPRAPEWRAGAPLPIAQKRIRIVRKARNAPADATAKTCIDDVTYPEVVGALPSPAEESLNARLRLKSLPLEPDCDTGYEYTVTYTTAANERGVLSFVYDIAYCCGAHPSYSKAFVNLTIPGRDELRLQALLRPGTRAQLSALLAPQVATTTQAVAGADAAKILAQLTESPAEFSIEPTGIRFSPFNSQPHAVQSAFQAGYFVPFTQLRDLVRNPGPLSALLDR